MLQGGNVQLPANCASPLHPSVLPGDAHLARAIYSLPRLLLLYSVDARNEAASFLKPWPLPQPLESAAHIAALRLERILLAFQCVMNII